MCPLAVRQIPRSDARIGRRLGCRQSVLSPAAQNGGVMDQQTPGYDVNEDLNRSRRYPMPAKDEIPSTLQRSPEKAQRTW